MLRAQNWREDRVWFHDVTERLRSLPANWTSTVAEDPFNVVAAGRAAFRVGELLEFGPPDRRMEAMSRRRRCKAKYAANVMAISSLEEIVLRK